MVYHLYGFSYKKNYKEENAHTFQSKALVQLMIMTILIALYNYISSLMYIQSFKSGEFGSSAFPVAAIQTLVTILITSIIFGFAYN